MARLRSREAETEDVNPRRLRRGAVKRQHLTRWAVGDQEIAPGVIGETHLGPNIINETHIQPGAAGSLAGGLTITLLGVAQTIAVGGSALVFSEVAAGPRSNGITVTPPTTSVVMPATRIVSVVLRFAWSTWRAGGTVSLLRDGVVVDSSPPSWGTRFDGVLHAGLVNEGETLSIEVDHQDASTHDLEDVRAAFKVEGPAQLVPAVGVTAGFYSTYAQTSGGFSLERVTAAGTTVLDSMAITITDTVWYYLRSQVVGQLVQSKVWAVGDPEPDWMLSAIDTEEPLAPGYAGVTAGSSASSSRDWDLLEVSHGGAVAVSNDMTSYTPGAGIPSGWERIHGTSTAWSIVSLGGGAQALRHTSDSNGSRLVWTDGGAGTDQDVVGRCRSNGNGNSVGIIWRGTSLL